MQILYPKNFEKQNLSYSKIIRPSCSSGKKIHQNVLIEVAVTISVDLKHDILGDPAATLSLIYFAWLEKILFDFVMGDLAAAIVVKYLENDGYVHVFMFVSFIFDHPCKS